MIYIRCSQFYESCCTSYFVVSIVLFLAILAGFKLLYRSVIRAQPFVFICFVQFLMLDDGYSKCLFFCIFMILLRI